MSVNKVILVGHVGKDPEIRYLDKDVAVSNFTMATTERSTTLQNGTVVPERTEWHNVVAWRGLATITERYIKKGTQIYVEGKITTRSWEKDGIKRYTTEIVAENITLLGRKPENGTNSTNAAQTIETAPVDIQPIPPVDDDLPF